uniref:Uncharacterized protein n=1 Tax=Craspedostauros australis TaxID=1486917 RepID=A0A7R9WYR2_9STRA|mmetsp:Transcript_4980/g.13212  ORF Transcript_4980/g.13212 Transcript_4980/m.13212 type:complete len:580 (+) Transcript_4980:134-1873(+)|eukprot:CAMPEP_0198111556 /NCGR_PEP_ID=MMETSP1442-20131203/3512_1 /TAXON_ID= /ORGANISM="Craspedostauros australis, Strain CCMP3328" /LENGTH=579 /DNA_ID=CAMNT_0043768043 /DNA_START=101 /DNA_END=1840 /DNA_ORIENTATION=+
MVAVSSKPGFGCSLLLWALYYSERCLQVDAQGVITATSQSSTPINDRCVNSAELVFSNSVTGTNHGANHDFFNAFLCGEQSDAKGVWYSVVGDGGTFTAHLCLDAVLSTALSTTESAATATIPSASFAIHTACNTEQRCLAFSEVGSAQCNNNEALGYAWNTTKDEEYFIQVRSYADISFQLSVETDTVTVPNDKCRDSILLQLGDRIKGDTSNATQDSFHANRCGTASNRPGIWYSVVGTGDELAASLCSERTRGTINENIDGSSNVFLSIYDGECDYNATTCVTYGTFQAECSQMSTDAITWNTVLNQTYHLHVHSSSTFAAFSMVISDASREQIIRTRKDACDATQDTPLDTFVNGSIHTTTVNFFDDTICGNQMEAIGNFHKFIGSGGDVVVTVCSPNDAMISASVGLSCSTHECLEHVQKRLAPCNHDQGVGSTMLANPADPITMRFWASQDEEYYIHVAGANPTEYILFIEDNAAPRDRSNDFKTWMLVVLVVFLVAIIALCGYMYVKRPDKRWREPKAFSAKQTKKEAKRTARETRREERHGKREASHGGNDEVEEEETESKGNRLEVLFGP